MMERKVGEVSHWYGQAHVAAMTLTGELNVGDTIHVKGHTTDFLQKVDSMQVFHHPIAHAERGDAIGVRVMEHARPHDQVFKVFNA